MTVEVKTLSIDIMSKKFIDIEKIDSESYEINLFRRQRIRVNIFTNSILLLKSNMIDNDIEERQIIYHNDTCYCALLLIIRGCCRDKMRI